MFENGCHMPASIALLEVIVVIAACVAYFVVNMKNHSPHLSALWKKTLKNLVYPVHKGSKLYLG